MVDECDVEKVCRFRWRDRRIGRLHYAVAKDNKTAILMHRVILSPERGQHIDHANGDGLDNRRHNLRFCNHSQNQANRAPQGGASKYKGVCRSGSKWLAGIKVSGIRHHLGVFEIEEDAARAYDRAAIDSFGQFARTNF